MTEWFARIFAGRPWTDIIRDIVDVVIVAYVVYRALLVVRGTRAMQMGVGLGVIFLLYLGAKVANLVTLVSLLSYLLSSIILIVVVVFQNDIRRALIRVGGQAWLGRGRKQEQSRVIDEVVAAVTECARHRIGAIIAFEQDANLLEFTKREGTVIGAAVTRELLVALFYPESVNKLHDGAVIIRDLKIARAGVFFPMPDTKLLDKSLGTRHSAALGITEETDAVVVVVSEERGTISFCFNGNIVPNLDGTALRQTLVGLLGQKSKAPVRISPPGPQREGRSSDGRSVEGRASEGRASEGRGTEGRGTDGRATAAPGSGPRPQGEGGGKPRESAIATPLPGIRHSTPPRGATTTPVRGLDGHERPRMSEPDIPRTSTMPLVTSKPMPRSSVTPPARERDDRLSDSQRPAQLDLELRGDDTPPVSDRTPISSAPARKADDRPGAERAAADRGEGVENDEADRPSFVPKVPSAPQKPDPVRGGEDS